MISFGVLTGLYIIEKKIKGFGDGEGNQRGKKEKERKFGKKNFWQYQIIKTDRIQTLTTLFYCFMRKKTIDFTIRRDTSRGRKSKAGEGGGNKKSDSILYTAGSLMIDCRSYRN